VLLVLAVDVREVEQHLPLQPRDRVRDDAIFSRRLALEQRLDGGGLRRVRVRDDGLGAGAETGRVGDRLADERVDQRGFADFLPADQADEVGRRVAVALEALRRAAPARRRRARSATPRR
jgi:hypothetical protein